MKAAAEHGIPDQSGMLFPDTGNSIPEYPGISYPSTWEQDIPQFILKGGCSLQHADMAGVPLEHGQQDITRADVN